MLGLSNHTSVDQFVEELFFKEWGKLVRYAKVQLRRYGPNTIDYSGRAEEIVQELFYTVCKKAEEVKACENPEGWLCNALYYKVKEALREDRKWVKCLSLLPSEDQLVYPQEILEMGEFLSKDDCLLLSQFYVEGYTYKELCAKYKCTKSCLAMRIHRAKKAFRKNYGNIFY